jgi:hypothetical protein
MSQTVLRANNNLDKDISSPLNTFNIGACLLPIFGGLSHSMWLWFGLFLPIVGFFIPIFMGLYCKSEAIDLLHKYTSGFDQ